MYSNPGHHIASSIVIDTMPKQTPFAKCEEIVRKKIPIEIICLRNSRFNDKFVVTILSARNLQSQHQYGLSLIVLSYLYHDISSTLPICSDLKDYEKPFCKVYKKMKDENIFNVQGLKHLCDYEHSDDADCKFGDKCDAFKGSVSCHYL